MIDFLSKRENSPITIQPKIIQLNEEEKDEDSSSQNSSENRYN